MEDAVMGPYTDVQLDLILGVMEEIWYVGWSREQSLMWLKDSTQLSPVHVSLRVPFKDIPLHLHGDVSLDDIRGEFYQMVSQAIFSLRLREGF